MPDHHSVVLVCDRQQRRCHHLEIPKNWEPLIQLGRDRLRLRRNTVLFLSVVFLACSFTTRDTAPFAITISSGGGFTGLVRGYRLDSEGRVSSFERRANNERIVWNTSTDAATVRAFGQKLLAIGPLAPETTGNMTSRIVYESEDSILIWTWSGSDPAFPALTEWYLKLTQYCASFDPEYAH